jgi:hypothetical protein
MVLQHPRAETVPPIQGTFLQLRADQPLTNAALRGLFLELRRLGLSHVVIQWTVAGTKAFYPSDTFESVPEPPLEPILELADEFGVGVRVGLAHDPQFWEKINLDSRPGDVHAYLQWLRQRSATVARELTPLVSRHRSFKGWFLTEEVDDVNWLSPERRTELRSFLSELRETLRSFGQSTSVAVSGFSNAYCDPSTLEAFWRELLSATRIDVLLFQDGIGTHKLELPYAALYLAAMKRAAAESGHSLGVVVELFEQVGGPPLNDGPFKAVPASMDRLAQQLVLAGNASTAEVLAFSVPDYMVPAAGPQAQRLFDDYVTRFHLTSSTPLSPF